MKKLIIVALLLLLTISLFAEDEEFEYINLVRGGYGTPYALSYSHSMVNDIGVFFLAFHRFGFEMAVDRYFSVNMTSMFGSDGLWFGAGPQFNGGRNCLEFVLYCDWRYRNSDDHDWGIWVTPRLVISEKTRLGLTVSLGYEWGDR